MLYRTPVTIWLTHSASTRNPVLTTGPEALVELEPELEVIISLGSNSNFPPAGVLRDLPSGLEPESGLVSRPRFPARRTPPPQLDDGAPPEATSPLLPPARAAAAAAAACCTL